MKQMHILSTLVDYVGPNNIKRATFLLKKIPIVQKTNRIWWEVTRQGIDTLGHIYSDRIYIQMRRSVKSMAVKKKGKTKFSVKNSEITPGRRNSVLYIRRPSLLHCRWSEMDDGDLS